MLIPEDVWMNYSIKNTCFWCIGLLLSIYTQFCTPRWHTPTNIYQRGFQNRNNIFTGAVYSIRHTISCFSIDIHNLFWYSAWILSHISSSNKFFNSLRDFVLHLWYFLHHFNPLQGLLRLQKGYTTIFFIFAIFKHDLYACSKAPEWHKATSEF